MTELSKALSELDGREYLVPEDLEGIYGSWSMVVEAARRMANGVMFTSEFWSTSEPFADEGPTVHFQTKEGMGWPNHKLGNLIDPSRNVTVLVWVEEPAGRPLCVNGDGSPATPGDQRCLACSLEEIAPYGEWLESL